jgi:hypothetical protein
MGLLNHQTSKFSLFCLMNQNLWMHILNLRFRRGNWAPNVWGTLELPGALIWNHQISIFSLCAYRVKICWWMFAIWGFKGGIGPPMLYWEYTSGVLAQEVYSLYLNNTLELNKNTMLIHCIWIQYIICNILCTIYNQIKAIKIYLYSIIWIHKKII